MWAGGRSAEWIYKNRWKCGVDLIRSARCLGFCVDLQERQNLQILASYSEAEMSALRI